MAWGDLPDDPWEALRSSRRAAAYPALPEPEAESALSGLTSGALSGLGYVGSELDKLFGGRAVRGVLGGRPNELLSLVPGSDVLGLTDPEDTVSGRDVLEHLGVLGRNKPGLDAGDVAGFLAEMALDPSMYLGGIGALTKAGQAARKAGTLTKGFLPSVRAGERTLMYGLRGPAVADALEGAGKLAGTANQFARNLPLVGGPLGAVEDIASSAGNAAKVAFRAKFSPPHGFYPNATVQEAHAGVYRPVQREVTTNVKYPMRLLQDVLQPVLDEGADPREVYRYLTQAVELPNRRTGLRQLPGPAAAHPLSAEHRMVLDALAPKIRDFADAIRQGELGRGLESPDLRGLYDTEYALRQASRATSGGENRGILGRLFGLSNPSQKRRLPIFDLPGGTIQLEDVIADPAFSLAARTPAGRKQVSARVLDLLTEPFGGLGAGGLPLSPEFYAELQKRSRGLARYLGTVKDEYIRMPGSVTPPAPFFKPDVLGNLLERGRRSAGSQGGAEAVYDIIRRAKVPAGTPGDQAITRVLAKAGMKTEEGYRRALQSVGLDPNDVLAAAQAAAEPGETLDLMKVYRKALGGFALPADEAKGAVSLLQRYSRPEEVGPIGRFLDRSLNLTKAGLYTIFPASHVRDLLSGMYENAIEGTWRPSAYQDALRILKGEGIESGLPHLAGLPPEAQRLGMIDELYAHGILDPLTPQGRYNEVLGVKVPDVGSSNPAVPRRIGVGPAVQEAKKAFQAKGSLNPLNIAGVKGGEDRFAPAVLGKAAGRNIQDVNRVAQFLDLRRRGYLPEAAADLVRKTHIDYGDMTDFERTVMRRIALFYTFSSRNIPKQVGRALQRPATIANPIRASQALGAGDEEYVPKYLSSGLALPLGRLGDEADSTRFLTQLGLPFEEAFGHLKVGAGPVSTAAQTFENLLASLRPEAKYALEEATGKQFWTGRNLADLKPGKLSTLGVLDDETARPLAQFVANTPLSRAVATAEKLLDTRKGAGANLLNLLTGVRVSDVDTAKWQAIDARDELAKLLATQPHLTRATDFYARPEQKAQLTAQEQYLLQLQAAARKRAREAAQERRSRIGVRPGGRG